VSRARESSPNLFNGAFASLTAKGPVPFTCSAMARSPAARDSLAIACAGPASSPSTKSSATARHEGCAPAVPDAYG
jgi:hypothetical protein